MKQRVSALILSLGLLLGMASGPMAQSTQAASLKVCGEVTVYVGLPGSTPVPPIDKCTSFEDVCFARCP